MLQSHELPERHLPISALKNGQPFFGTDGRTPAARNCNPFSNAPLRLNSIAASHSIDENINEFFLIRLDKFKIKMLPFEFKTSENTETPWC